ncbi:TPA: hypothetical protein U1B14_001429 [Streptococcus suis]|uniref:hypothetical protein n=1 Tax=Streptococcus suis TaxID=1307 RepID=UPI00209B8E75|nr:hypothetical protein [Streptococcus suis]MCO8207805.1 hypothetical protein [Streptococcus suis]MCO8212158.1 hypothetical protein [Streptococcus suis]HEM3492036.1 hypothetical protein [Streptococcus suis]HEM3494326.1 hypothetical protein [Streptococcus suis]
MTLTLYFAKTQEYKNIIQKYIDALTEWRRMVELDLRPERITEFRKNAKNDILNAYNSYRDKKIDEARQQMETIEKRYKNTRNVYLDPQVEILRRQDFDLEFSTMERNDIIELLSDEKRDFTDYELRKINTHYRGDMKIQVLLENQKMKKGELYKNDPEYQKHLEEFQTLQAFRSIGLGMVYFPTSENERGYTTENFELVLDSEQYAHSLSNEIQKIVQLLGEIPTTEAKTSAFTKALPVKKMEFEEFDERIFEESPNYDITIRFKYLKERLDDTTTDRWDFTRDDYDAYQHYLFLENRHEQKLKNDPRYKNRYINAKNKVIAQIEEDITNN